MIKAFNIEAVKSIIENMSENEMETRKEIFLSELLKSWKHKLIYPEVPDYDRGVLIEKLVWIDLRLERIPLEEVKSWWFRAKRRVYYANDMRKYK